MEGLEPSTPALRKPCSTIELHRRLAVLPNLYAKIHPPPCQSPFSSPIPDSFYLARSAELRYENTLCQARKGVLMFGQEPKASSPAF